MHEYHYRYVFSVQATITSRVFLCQILAWINPEIFNEGSIQLKKGGMARRREILSSQLQLALCLCAYFSILTDAFIIILTQNNYNISTADFFEPDNREKSDTHEYMRDHKTLDA